jgi:hypothetical protein
MGSTKDCGFGIVAATELAENEYIYELSRMFSPDPASNADHT